MIDKKFLPKTKNPGLRQIRRRRNEVLGWTKTRLYCHELFVKLWVLPNGFIYYVEIVEWVTPDSLYNESVPFGRQLIMAAWKFVQMFGNEWREPLLQTAEQPNKHPYRCDRKFLELLWPIQLPE